MISVIVPVYNVEVYLGKCIQSILGQSYKDFELILVDDGSTDNSGVLCDKYAEKDKRIKVIHKKNGGLSDARNKGTESANGEFVTFIDSDDYVSLDYLETLWKIVSRYGADIAVTGITRFYDGEKPKKMTDCNRVRVYSKYDALRKVFYQDGLDTSACAMLIPSQIAKSILFPKGKFHEDDFTTYKFYLHVKRVGVAYKKQYYYRQRHGSIMHSFGKASKDELDAADGLVNYCNDSLPLLTKAAESKKFSDYCQVLLSDESIRFRHPTQYRRIMDYLSKHKYGIILDKNTRLKNKVAATCLVFGYGFLKTVNRMITKVRG